MAHQFRDPALADSQIDDLLEDVGHAQRTRRERHGYTALLPGRMIDDERVLRPVDLTDDV